MLFQPSWQAMSLHLPAVYVRSSSKQHAPKSHVCVHCGLHGRQLQQHANIMPAVTVALDVCSIPQQCGAA
jgi:hypothetical protein